MGRLQVLVATMHQTDFSLIEKMNIQADVIIANQADYEAVSECSFGPYHAKMITTRTRGVGVNRNIALLAADADILLFADDDISYYDGYADAVVRAFEQQPDADMMVFGIAFTKNDAVYKRRNVTKGRKRLWNALRYGAGVLAVKRRSLFKANVCFSLLFGGGCKYSCGEDSLFIVECLRRGLKLYADPFVLGKCAKDTSSWFRGYTPKYYFDKGVWIAAAFPKTKHLIKYYFWLTQKNSTDLPAGKILRLINHGIRGYRTQEEYGDTP